MSGAMYLCTFSTQGKAIFLTIRGMELQWVEPESSCPATIQPINRIRVWGIGIDNDRCVCVCVCVCACVRAWVCGWWVEGVMSKYVISGRGLGSPLTHTPIPMTDCQCMQTHKTTGACPPTHYLILHVPNLTCCCLNIYHRPNFIPSK